MKRIKCLLCILVVVFLTVSVHGAVPISAKGCVLMEALTGEVLYEYQADAVLPMASTTKLFTALMVRECCQLDEVVTVSASAADTEGSSAYLTEGEKLTVEQLLYALLLSSGNDAAEVLAEHAFDGDRERFIRYMNQRAIELGLESTHFTNPSGLPDDEHYTNARELAYIGRLVTRDPVLSRIVASQSVSFESESGMTHSYTNHNSLLRMYDCATGLKTGYTKAAGRCLVSSAQKNGVTLICVTLNDPNDWDDHITLLEYGFSRVKRRCLYPQYTARLSVSVLGGRQEQLEAGNESPIYLPQIEGMEDYQIHLIAEPALFAPIEKGQTVGMCYAVYKNHVVAQFDIVALASVETSEVSEQWFIKELKRIFKFILL